MFTGIVTDIGKVSSIERRGDWRIAIETAFDPATIEIGASIACSGACLTVVERGAKDGKGWFSVEVSEETRRCTSLGAWQVGTRINLERSLRMGDEIGGHMVLGHVDGLGTIAAMTEESSSVCVRFAVPTDLMRFVAPKGSIAVDGVSLTVNAVGSDWFEVNIIPHTQKVTTFGDRRVGDAVHLEIDVLARYVARLKEAA